jgi:hypothetical protein
MLHVEMGSILCSLSYSSRLACPMPLAGGSNITSSIALLEDDYRENSIDYALVYSYGTSRFLELIFIAS